MANNAKTAIDGLLDQDKNRFKLDVLKGHSESLWPQKIDYVAKRASSGRYTIGIQSDQPYEITDGESLDDVAHEFYLEGISDLTGNRRYRSALPSNFPLGSLLVQFAGMLEGMDEVDYQSLTPGEVLGRLITRNIKRQASGDQIRFADHLSDDIHTPRGLVAELCRVPELSATVRDALPDGRDANSFTDQLADVDLTTKLWDHQHDALVEWIDGGSNGYVNMATATGKTVLGLAAVAHSVSAGSLHPDDQEQVSEECDTAPVVSQPNDAKNVLIVTTDELLGVQWARLFQTHCHTPPEFTKITDGSIKLPWGRIDLKSAGGLGSVDPEDYQLAIFDEVHNYTKSTGWGEGLEEFVESGCPVLALTGSETGSLQRLASQSESDFSKDFTYTHEKALEEGVIPDFQWSLHFSPVDEDTGALENLTETATLADGLLEYEDGVVQVRKNSLAEQLDDLNSEAIDTIAGEYETGPRLASALRTAGPKEETAPTPDLETLASGLSNRSINRLNLKTDLDPVLNLAEDALSRGRPTLILTQSYGEAKKIWKALYDRHGDRVVKRIERDDSPAEQDEMITDFDAEDTDEKVLIGPGKHIGQGNDIQSVEVGINISRPGSGLNATLVQRLGRLLRGAGEKSEVEFYHVLGVQPQNSVLQPDGESFIHNVCEFFAQSLAPDSDGIDKPPQVSIESEEVSTDIAALEAAGHDSVLQSDQLTEIEQAYSTAIAEADPGTPTIATSWFSEAFPESVETVSTPTGDAITGRDDVSETVEIDPVVLACARFRAQADDEYDSTTDLVLAALDRFLDAVEGNVTQVEPDLLEPSDSHTLTFDCDPALEMAIEAKADTVEDSTAEEAVRRVMFDWLEIDRDTATVTIEEYQRYQSRIESLRHHSHCPCTDAGEVVQVAIETHLDI